MLKGKYWVSGLMSGTSLDGTDLAHCTIACDGESWAYQILGAETVLYPPALGKKLINAHRLDLTGAMDLDQELGHYYAALLNDFHKKHGFRAELIASHGHTLFHDPERRLTFQAGNGAIIARKTGVTTVTDFRREDVSLGGQGAPLVPVGDQHLFGSYDACLNLGGIANISWKHPSGVRMAHDICPANMALNHLAGMLGQKMDRNGSLAASGKVDTGLLGDLDALPYYRQSGARSLGREWFDREFLPLVTGYPLPVKDLLATCTEHISRQICLSAGHSGASQVLVTGGGALNLNLKARLEFYMQDVWHYPDETLIHFKEALVFAFLGVLRIRGEINCLASVTGGPRDLCCGTIFNT